jgi:hypothetical protein
VKTPDNKNDNGLRPLLMRAEIMKRKFDKLTDVSLDAVQAMDLLGEIRDWLDDFYPMMTDASNNNRFTNWAAFLRSKLDATPPKHSGSGKILAALFNVAPSTAAAKRTLNLAIATNLFYEDRLADDKIVDVYVCHLRSAAKGGPLEGQVETVWGTGYRLTEEGRRVVSEWRKEFEERTTK